MQALIVYTGMASDLVAFVTQQADTFSRIPDSTLEDAPVDEMAHLDQPSSICLRRLDGQ